MAARNVARVIATYGEHEPVPTEAVGGSLRNALDVRGVRNDVEGIEADGGRAHIFVNGVRVADLAAYEALAQAEIQDEEIDAWRSRRPEGVTAVAIVETTVCEVSAFHAKCLSCGWRCHTAPHAREFTAVRHAQGHTCGVIA